MRAGYAGGFAVPGGVGSHCVAKGDVPPTGPNGKRLRKKITGPTRKAVADKLRELRREQNAGVDVRKRSIDRGGPRERVADALGAERGDEGGSDDPATAAACGEAHHPGGADRGRRLDQLTVAQVEAWLRREAESGGQKGKPQARATCRDYKQMLGEMLEWAVARRYINWNPARIAKLPKDRSATNRTRRPSTRSRRRRSRSPRAVRRADGRADRTGDDAIKTPTPKAYSSPR